MVEFKLLEMIRLTKGRAKVALSAILDYRRGRIDERRMIITVTEYKHALFSVIPKFFGGCSDNIGTANVLSQLIYNRGLNTVELMNCYR